MLHLLRFLMSFRFCLDCRFGAYDFALTWAGLWLWCVGNCKAIGSKKVLSWGLSFAWIKFWVIFLIFARHPWVGAILISLYHSNYIGCP